MLRARHSYEVTENVYGSDVFSAEPDVSCTSVLFGTSVSKTAVFDVRVRLDNARPPAPNGNVGRV